MAKFIGQSVPEIQETANLQILSLQKSLFSSVQAPFGRDWPDKATHNAAALITDRDEGIWQKNKEKEGTSEMHAREHRERRAANCSDSPPVVRNSF
jgi:hypothetical protein